MGYAEQIAKNFSSRFSLSLTALEQGSTSLGPPKRRIAHRAKLNLISDFLQDIVAQLR
ncbi:MAG TPA: hypothetical protein VFE60_23330 [Roseiarcus sp.]|jgi:hypothetical protein|nr:hypothetical protein [Roseiarcus sp.]